MTGLTALQADTSALYDAIHLYRKPYLRVDKAHASGQNPYHSNQISHLMTSQCKHPIVKIVSRDEDAEYVECQTCGEIFDSAEFSDMAIEEEALDDDEK
jgi:hypothetical protein